jgi:hypothetical protein
MASVNVRAALGALAALPIALALVLVATACSSSDPHASPEAATRAFISAANRNDVSGMRAVAISPERLGRALSCTADDTKVDILEAITDARAAMVERAGMNVGLMSIVEESRRSVAAGDDYRGCRATEPFELRRLRMQIAVDDGGGKREKLEEGDVIHLDGRWYLVIPSP